MGRPLLVAACVILTLGGCQLIEPGGGSDGYEQPGSRLEGTTLVARWTAQPFPWEIRSPITQGQLAGEPGGQWKLPYRATVDLSSWTAGHGRPEELIVGVLAEWRHDEEGSFRAGPHTFSVSSNFTTTGLPVERSDGWPDFRLLHGHNGSPFEAISRHPLSEPLAEGPIALEGTLVAELPTDLPRGWYEPQVHILVKVEGVAQPVHLAEFSYEWNDWSPGVLPLVQVGEPEPIQLPWLILAEYTQAGRVGTLPTELSGRVGQVGRSGFVGRLVLRPGTYEIAPTMPTLYPRDGIARVDGGDDVQAERSGHFIRFDTATASARVRGPGEELFRDLGTRPFAGGEREFDRSGGGGRPRLVPGPFQVDMSRTGSWTVVLEGETVDAFGRPVRGGGTYEFEVAHHLSFSTSCKPGTSFLVGDSYPAKVNVNPPFPAQVEVIVDWFPDSDPDRKVRWVGRGTANAHGHFVPYDTPPLAFEEPGEYVSYVEARYVDSRGQLWLNRQTSGGVVAPVEPDTVRLHGTRSFPWVDYALEGAEERFRNRQQVENSYLPQTNLLLQDPFVPYHAGDTLVMPVNFSEENTVQPKFSFEALDEELSSRLTAAHSRATALPIPWSQPADGVIRYLSDVVSLSTEGFAFFDTSSGTTDELPIASVGDAGWHPFSFPQKRSVEAYAYAGVVRPGLPVLTSIFDFSPKGFYWTASPNAFGSQLNRGLNGDMPGDVYRVAAGMVLKDRVTGRNHYDAFATSVVFLEYDDAPGTASILAPGDRELRRANGKEFKVFLATDTHDTLGVGEKLGLGGVVVPIVPAEVQWTVTSPSGRVHEVTGKTNRLGVVRGRPLIDVDEPGRWRIEPKARWNGLEGELPGLVDGSFWHCAVEPEIPTLLRSSVPARTHVDATEGFDIVIQWPTDIEDARLSFGIITPGQVLDQGEVAIEGGEWTYYFQPIQWMAQTPNFDARELASGQWTVGETMVFQFFLEGHRGGVPIHDAMRLFLRGNTLYNYRELLD